MQKSSRKRLSKADKRTEQVLILLSPKEFSTLKEVATAKGMGLSTFLRSAGLEAAIRNGLVEQAFSSRS